jgi:hypothetical protein
MLLLTVACKGVDPAAALLARDPVPAVCERSAFTLVMAVGEGVSPVKWLAVSQAEQASTKPTTVATTHPPMCRRPDAGGDGLHCRAAVLVR